MRGFALERRTAWRVSALCDPLGRGPFAGSAEPPRVGRPSRTTIGRWGNHGWGSPSARRGTGARGNRGRTGWWFWLTKPGRDPNGSNAGGAFIQAEIGPVKTSNHSERNSARRAQAGYAVAAWVIRRTLIVWAMVLCVGAGRVAGDGASGPLLLWEVSQPPGRVYLLGSIHAMRPQDHPLPQLVEDVFAAADQVMFEADIERAKSPEVQPILLQLALYLDGTVRAQHLDAALEKRVLAYGTANNLDLSPLYRPWFLANLITLTELKKAGFEEDLGTDPYFFAKIKADGRPLLFLEEVEFQFKLLAGASEKNQIRDLSKLLDDPADVARQTAALVQEWTSGDVAGLRAATDAEATADPAEFERLVTSRNRTWVPRIEALLNQGKTTLLIAGAAHMVGESGVVNLLRKNGHDVWELPRPAGGGVAPRIASAQALAGRSVRLVLARPSQLADCKLGFAGVS